MMPFQACQKLMAFNHEVWHKPYFSFSVNSCARFKLYKYLVIGIHAPSAGHEA
jgi:hypothetical protein